MFEAPESFAWQVHVDIGTAQNDGSLRYCWWLNANFRANGKLQWCIEPNYRIPRWRYLPLIRREVDNELVRLAVVLGNAAR